MGEHVAYERAEPNASATLESLRAIGYSPEAAVADLVDNSISAGATRVRIDASWAGADSYLRIEDNGVGMSATELREAMRPSSKSPLDARSERDLGRFGMGLKTASFSQARRLVVATRSASSPEAVRCWDLDHVKAVNDWQLLVDVGPVSQQRVAMPSTGSGTVVLWEKMDRLVGESRIDDADAHQRFLHVLSVIEQHLSMVFHRLMGGRAAVQLELQRRVLTPWDPFMETHPATQRLQEERLPLHGSVVTVGPFVLPHHDKLTQEQYEQGGGLERKFGWTPLQGFYVYRNRRLVVAGDWLGTHQREVHYQLARIRVDIDNQHDSDWRLDVKKASAKPPAMLRTDFKRIADVTRKRASEVYRLRGKLLARQTSLPFVFVWRQHLKAGRISYRIDRAHPLVRAALDVAGETRQRVHALLSLLEETVPTALIAMDRAERPQDAATPFEGRPEADVREVMREMYAAMRREGVGHEESVTRVRVMEPFADYPLLLAELEELQ